MFRATNRKFLTAPTPEVTSPNGRRRYFVEGRSTLRAPSNVSFVTDNAWELLRLTKNPLIPSRRVSAFASPTEAQAMESAVNTEAEIFKVTFENSDPFVAVLHGYLDAKFHPDINRIQRAFAAQAMSDAGFREREHLLVDLFLPLGFKAAPSWQEGDEAFVFSLLSKTTFLQDVEVLPSSKIDPSKENCEIWFDQTSGYWLEEI